MEHRLLSLGELLAESDGLLREAGVDSPRLSSQILAGHALGLDRVRLVVDARRVLSAAEIGAVRGLVARRAAGEPVAYILGEKEFYGLDFRVTSDVLVPRPETEHVIEEVCRRFAPDAAFLFADLGTGSGCIAVTLAHLFPRARGLALDRSAAALDVARGNALGHGVRDRLCFVHGDMASDWARPGSLDLVVSNPPYVSEAEYRTVSFEVSDFEPRGALVPSVGVVAESDGLECYRALAPRASRALKQGGALVLEIGWDQGRTVPDVLAAAGGFGPARVLPDLAGRDRVVVVSKL